MVTGFERGEGTVKANKKELLLTYVQVLAYPRFRSRKIYLQGLDPNAVYHLEGTDEHYSGEMLMRAGYLVGHETGDFRSRLYHFVAE